MKTPMDIKKEIGFLRENFIFYLAGALVILGLKCYYRQADCDSLLWILAPTAHWVEFLSKIPFTYISGAGYVNHSLRMVIAPSCSGVRFMIIAFAMLVFSFVHRVASGQTASGSEGAVLTSPDASLPVGSGARSGLRAKARGLGWIAVSAFFSWIFTVFVNGLRIITAIYLPMYLESAGLMGGMLTQERLHTMIGVAVYFAALLLLYRLAAGLIQGGTGEKASFVRKCVPPVFWYLALTLGLPLISRVYRGSTVGFAEFAALVTGCCAMILLPCIIAQFLRRRKN
ncbi:MAG: exosortase K [Lachnospiraceae bacterium]|nr:exosortase K [Butyrivibrio sp.]MCM1411040.1 exosortase K [Lachnospiraceae bacterium]